MAKPKLPPLHPTVTSVKVAVNLGIWNWDNCTRLEILDLADHRSPGSVWGLRGFLSLSLALSATSDFPRGIDKEGPQDSGDCPSLGIYGY